MMDLTPTQLGDRMTQSGDRKPRPLDEATVRKIGQKLRENYDEVVNEPVPDRFAALLDALEQSEETKDKPQ